MDEYIDRETATNVACNILWKMNDLSTSVMAKALNSIPAADVAPMRHGRWIDAYPDIEPNPMFMYGICSECRFEQGISKYLNYCPNCGAKIGRAHV